MNKCEDCKFSEPYFRGLLCHWIEKRGVPNIPAYLKIVGISYSGLESCYPFQLDSADYGDKCCCFESKSDEIFLDMVWDINQL
jgi:hypothetical protein